MGKTLSQEEKVKFRTILIVRCFLAWRFYGCPVRKHLFLLHRNAYEMSKRYFWHFVFCNGLCVAYMHPCRSLPENTAFSELDFLPIYQCFNGLCCFLKALQVGLWGVKRCLNTFALAKLHVSLIHFQKLPYCFSHEVMVKISRSHGKNG